MTESEIKFSIVVPTYNRRAKLERCLNSLLSQEYPKDKYEIIVVDDASPDDTASFLAGLNVALPQFRVLRQEKNQGPAKARNVGVRLACGEFIAFTDDDCRPLPDWLSQFDSRLSGEDKPDGIVGYQIPSDESLQGEFGARYEFWLSKTIYGYGKPENIMKAESAFAGTNNFCLTRAWFEKLGGFNEAFELPAGEDREFVDRLLAAGAKVLRSNIKVIHGQDYDTPSMLRQQIARGKGYARYRYLRGHPVASSELLKAKLKNYLCFPKDILLHGPAMAFFMLKLRVAQKQGIAEEMRKKR